MKNNYDRTGNSRKTVQYLPLGDNERIIERLDNNGRIYSRKFQKRINGNWKTTRADKAKQLVPAA